MASVQVTIEKFKVSPDTKTYGSIGNITTVYPEVYLSTKTEYLKFWRKKKGDEEISAFHAKLNGRKAMWFLSDFSIRMVINKSFERVKVLSIKSFDPNFIAPTFIDFAKWRGHMPQLRELKLARTKVTNLNVILPQLERVDLCHVDEQASNNSAMRFGDNVSAIFVFNCNIFRNNNADFSNCLRLEVIDIFGCDLTTFPLLPSNGRLYFLNLSRNNIQEIPCFPASLRKIILTNNLIKKIPEVPVELKYLEISHNPMRQLPSNILLCHELSNINFYNTELELTTLEMRFIENVRLRNQRLRGQDTRENAYGDQQIVHNSSIQKSLLVSCNNLFRDTFPAVAFTTTGNEMIDNILKSDFRNLDRHSVLEKTFKDIFDKVWNRIQAVEDEEKKGELVQRLIEEVGEGAGKCFTGKVTRIVNALVGFFSDIQLQVSDAEQIVAKIQASIKRNGGLKRREIEAELEEISVEPKRIKEWIAAFEEHEANE